MVIRGVGELWRISWTRGAPWARSPQVYLSGPETSVRKCPLPVIINTCVSKKDLRTTSRASRRARGGSRL